MHGLGATDGGRAIDWGRTSGDYARWRPDYPDGLYAALAAAGVGLAGQDVLDLGTGTGLLARRFARAGARVVGVDASSGQVAEAARLAAEEGLDATFRVAPAESTGLPGASFDAVTAGQCWLYFDPDRAVREVLRLLRPGGLLATCHLCWLPRADAVARASEELVLRFNPDWSAADWPGDVPERPAWAGAFDVVRRVVLDVDVPFTHAAWRGRFRACRGVGAALAPDEVEAFDRAHAERLRALASDPFTVRHRADAHVLRPRAAAGPP